MEATRRLGCQAFSRISIDDVELELIGELTVREGLSGGVQLHGEVTHHESLMSAVGRIVSLDLEVDGVETTRFELRVHEAVYSEGVEGQRWVISAADPLSLSRSQPQFRSWLPGGRCLSALVRAVLSDKPMGSCRSPVWGDPDPSVRKAWLLQAGESDGIFLDRIAREVGGRLFWHRDGVAFGRLGAGPSAAEHIDLDRHAFSQSHARGLDLISGECVCIDEDTRQLQRSRTEGSDAEEVMAGRGHPPADPQQVWTNGFQSLRPLVYRLDASTDHPRVAIGCQIKSSEGLTARVEEVEHYLTCTGRSYSNRVIAVPSRQWGLDRPAQLPTTLGPFQARVYDNEDPRRQGRIRAVLEEDRDSHPTPWIPVVAPAGGSYGGFSWLPEIDERVLLVAEREHPEGLVCLGTIRGSDTPLPTDHVETKNRLKVFSTPGGLRLEFDDRKSQIRVIAGEARLEVGSDGTISIGGKTISIGAQEELRLESGRMVRIEAEREVEIEGGNRILQDAKQIHLGRG